MPSPTSTAPHVPKLLRRRVARGSALGMGLLVASGAAAPAALAEDDDPTTGNATLAARDDAQQVSVDEVLEQWEPAELSAEDLVPDFGAGKTFIGAQPLVLSIEPEGRAPADLDLGGAVLAFRDVDAEEGDEPAAVCVTDVHGTCKVDWPDDEGVEDRTSVVGLDEGTYVVEQVAGVEGLAPAEGVIWTFQMSHDCLEGLAHDCFFPLYRTVPNESLFSSAVVTTVLDEESGTPLAGAGYRLTGPDYRHSPEAEIGDDCQDGGQPGNGELPPELPPIFWLLGVEAAGVDVGTEPGTTEPTTVEPTTVEPSTPEPAVTEPGTVEPDTTESDTVEPAAEVGTVESAAEVGTTESAAEVGTTEADVVPPAETPGSRDVDPESLELATSDESGVLEHRGCLLPGTWTLEPMITPDGYEPQSATVVLDDPYDAETGEEDRVVEVTVELGQTPAAGGPAETPTDPTTPTTTPAPPTTDTGPTGTDTGTGTSGTGTGTSGTGTSGAGTGTGTSGTGTATTGTGGTGPAPVGTGGGAARPAAGQAGVPAAAPSSVPSAAPTTAAVPPAASSGSSGSASARPTAIARPIADPAPALESRSSSAFLQVGVIGFGLLFAGLVFFLVLWLRRRAAEQRG